MRLTTADQNQVDVTLFVPSYNEQDNIVPTLLTTVQAAQQSGYSYEILVYDDASTDKTVGKVVQFQRDNPNLPIRLVANRSNNGLAYTFLDGAIMARGKYYRIVCGDNVEPLSTQLAILAHLGKCDIVIPFPVAVKNKTPFRRVLSQTYGRLVNVASGYNLKYWNGCGLFRRCDVIKWHNHTHGFGFQAILLSTLLDLGNSYIEVGCTYNERTTGQSKALTLRNIRSVIYVLGAILIRRIGRRLKMCQHTSPGHLDKDTQNVDTRQSPTAA